MHALRVRRSDRVHLTFPLRVISADLDGHHFDEKGRTLVIGRHGAAILLSRKLFTDQELIVHCIGNNKEAEARVIGLIGGQDQAYIYGIVLLNPTADLWGVEFPPLTGTETAAARTLLKCNGCQSREVVYFNEIEVEVFDVNRSLQRFCKSCGASTLWRQESQEVSGDLLAPRDEPAAKQNPATKLPRTQEDRTELRVQIKMTACIRQPGFPEELVQSENASRGGFCFTSRKSYLKESRVEVAVPYSRGGGNIFVVGKIAYVQPLTSEDGFRHGVAYLKGAGAVS